MPVSITATVTVWPVEIAHASGASISASGRTYVETKVRDRRDDAVEQLAGVVERPLLLEHVIARYGLGAREVSGWLGRGDRRRDAANEIRFRIQHVWIPPVAIDGAGFIAGGNRDQLDTRAGDLVQHASAALAVRLCFRRRSDARLELHENLTGHRAARAGCLRRGICVERERNETCGDERFDEAHEDLPPAVTERDKRLGRKETGQAACHLRNCGNSRIPAASPRA
jgi:hypothetical protein